MKSLGGDEGCSGVCADCTDRPQSNLPIAHRDVRRLERQAGLRTHERISIMLATRLPAFHAVAHRFAVTRLPLRGQRRVWFQWMTRTRTGFPFHLLTFTINIEKAAKHLTTSPTMLTAAKAIGKLQTRADSLGCLID